MEILFKEFTAFVLARARQFLEDFIDFIGAPKAFLASASVYSSENLARAFSFFVILQVLVKLLFVFLTPLDDDVNRMVLLNIAYTILFTGGCLRMLQLSWRLVGARPPLRRVMLCFFYFAGIAVIIQAFLLIAVAMIMVPIDETLALMDRFDALDAADPAAGDAFLQANPALALQYIGVLTAFAIYVAVDVTWTIIVWGAFRTLAAVGKLRSAVAMTVFYLLSCLVFFFGLTFLEAFVPGAGGAPL
jgi:hypothetical protein